MRLKVSPALVALACAATLLVAPAATATPSYEDRAVTPPVTGTLNLRPSISQPGKRPVASSGKTQALATFTNTRTGQRVKLQQDTGSGWVTVASGREHRSGSTILTLPTSKGLYRAVAVTRSGRAIGVTAAVRARRFRTLFRDEFSGTRVDHTKWTDQPTLAPAYMRMCSTLSPGARVVRNGVLEMGVAYDTARAGETCTWTLNGRTGSHPYMLNTQLYTGGKFQFTYGYAAVRMRMHLDKGMHASFWMQPANWYTPGDPSKGTEIDIVEFFGRTKKDSHIASFLHWYDDANLHHKLGGKFPGANRLKKQTETWSTSFHVFSAEWTSDAIVFRVDGREFWRQTEIVSRAPEYLLLSMLTSDYELEKLSSSTIDQRAKVDWVRVWSH